MIRTTHATLLATMMLLTCTIGAAQAVPDAGFERSPLQWRADSRLSSADRNVRHSGEASLRIVHGQPFATRVASGPVRLRVGSLYRLSAWVKTEEVRTSSHDQYPTSLGACISMASFPFTESSVTAGGTSEWKKLEVLFIATQRDDSVCLHLGKNGGAAGSAWFDDVTLEEEKDITRYIPMETVKWSGEAFRFEDRGWIYVHIEGAPYARGSQYGYLVADEIKEFINKLSINKNNSQPQVGWNEMRFATDALMLRKFDAEYLEEMKGIADGANRGGATVFGKPLTLLDVATLNCAVDVSYAGDALPVTPTPLTGKSFLSAEDDLTIQERLHKCSSFLATASATKDKRIVFGQLFMWNGYTGIHWNVIVDVAPTTGRRLVYQTFPGGIHSGADFYLNDAGIMIGETTVNQGPFDADGTPQSYRIRKAAQYAESIDDVVRIMTEKNNGLYTNDWLIGDAKTNEIAVLALGTKKWTLWRSSRNQWYDGQKDWYWSDNNLKSDDVRREYVTNEENAPYDVAFKPVNRDIAFRKFYTETYGAIDGNAGINVLATSPINRPHACDGKVTTGAMADNMMFFAHSGKVTLREKFVGENGRIPDLAGAQPQLTLGYAVISPYLFTEKLKEAHKLQSGAKANKEPAEILDSVSHVYSYEKKLLWRNSIFPASSKENWYISGTAAYWNLLNAMPAVPAKAAAYMRDELTELNCRYLYTTKREGPATALDARVSYDQYKYYQVPRIRGTVALHQVRLLLGNEAFSKALSVLHKTYAGKEITNSQIIETLERETGRKLAPFLLQWLERNDLPAYTVTTEVLPQRAPVAADNGCTLKVTVSQPGKPYHFFTTLAIETGKGRLYRMAEISGATTVLEFVLSEKPASIQFNAGADIPVDRDRYYTFSNFSDDFAGVRIVYGTTRQVEAQHTLALRFQKMAADRFTETLLPVCKDTEIGATGLAAHDFVVIGGMADNALTSIMAEKLGIEGGKNFFRWNGKTYGGSDDGLFVAAPNPFNAERTVYLFIGNSPLEVHAMTKTLPRLPGWAVYKKDAVVEKGYHPLARVNVKD